MTNPPSDPTLHPDLRRAIRAAIQSHPDAYMRSRAMYNIVRECYDAITALAPDAGGMIKPCGWVFGDGGARNAPSRG